MGRTNGPFLVGILTLLISSLASSKVSHSVDWSRVNIFQLANSQVVTFYQDEPMDNERTPSRYRRFLRDNLVSGKPVYFIINKGLGGLIDIHSDFMELIRAKARASITMVVFGQCDSACTFWGPKADRSLLVSGYGNLNVHLVGSKLTRKPDTLEKTSREYDAVGATKNWAINNPDYFPENGDFRYLDPRAARDFGIIDGTISFEELGTYVGPQIHAWLDSLVDQ